MRRRAAAISAAEPEQRLPLPEAHDELHRLGETLNEMLGRLEVALERERAFVDDASHELRTPLALHKTELELALRYAKTEEEWRAAIASAIEEVDRLSALAEDLLVLARSEEGKLALHLRTVRVSRPARRCSGAIRGPDRRLRALARGRAGRRPDDRRRPGAPRAGAHQPGRERDRPRGRARSRSAPAQAAGDLEIHVEDRGPGFPADFLDRAFERFSRARPGAGRRWHGPRPGDRRGDRPRPPGQRARRQPRWQRSRRLDRAAPLAGLSRPIHRVSVERVAQRNRKETHRSHSIR